MSNTLTTAAMAPLVVAGRNALDHGTPSFEAEPDRFQADEGSQIRAAEGSVEHIEALDMDGIGTLIVKGLDPYPQHPERSSSTVNWEEPSNSLRLVCATLN